MLLCIHSTPPHSSLPPFCTPAKPHAREDDMEAVDLPATCDARGQVASYISHFQKIPRGVGYHPRNH